MTSTYPGNTEESQAHASDRQPDTHCAGQHHAGRCPCAGPARAACHRDPALQEGAGNVSVWRNAAQARAVSAMAHTAAGLSLGDYEYECPMSAA